MKKTYIRTATEIFTLEENIYNQVFAVNNKGEWEEFEYILIKNKILAKADSPEKLCDLFIDEETKTIFHKHNGYVINWETNLVYSLEKLVKVFHSVKGAIYTDKGLIYVTKMNENGDWKLI